MIKNKYYGVNSFNQTKKRHCYYIVERTPDASVHFRAASPLRSVVRLPRRATPRDTQARLAAKLLPPPAPRAARSAFDCCLALALARRLRTRRRPSNLSSSSWETTSVNGVLPLVASAALLLTEDVMRSTKL